MVILIVDDELPIREWMKFTLEKTGMAGTEILLAANGSEALEIVRAQPVDVVFADIRMPVMDGIALLQQIKAIDGDISVTILTSYADFNYARTAVDLKADGYVLKSEITPQIIRDILEKHEQKAQSRQPRESIENQVKRMALFQGLIDGKPEVQDAIADKLREAGIPLCDQALLCMAVRIHSVDPVFDFKTGMPLLYNNSLANESYVYIDKKTFVIITNVNRERFFSDAPSSQYAYWIVIDRITKLFENSNVGISNIGDGLHELRTCIRQSLQALNSTFYTQARIQRFSNLPATGELPMAALHRFVAALRTNIEKFDMDRIRETLGQFFDTVQASASFDADTLMRFVNALMEELNKLQPAGHDPAGEDFSSFMSMLNAASSFQELKGRFFEAADELLKAFEKRTHNDYVHKALNYIHQNYSTIASVHEVTNLLNISVEYFCRLFKKATGTTFIAYLTRYRMDKASGLLRTTAMSINEIARAVGYDNVNYFSRTYKKVIGVNPSDRRIQQPI